MRVHLHSASTVQVVVNYYRNNSSLNIVPIALTDGSESDIEAVFLCDELISIHHFTKINNCNSSLDVLNLIKNNHLEDPNIWISLRILFTIPVRVASGERSFSKLS